MTNLSIVDGRVEWRGKRVRLSRQRFAVVYMLTREPGQVVLHAELREMIWEPGQVLGHRPADWRHTLRQLVYCTVEQFRRVDKKFSQIEPVIGVGYRWRVESGNDA